MNKSITLIAILSLLLSVSVSAQNLTPSTKVPTVDGLIAVNEYSVNGTYNGMNLGLSLSADGKTLFVSLVAPTTGWVSVGLGSLKMDGAFMVLGYDNAGTPAVSEETGKGHGHKPNAVKKLSASAVKESGKSTTLEFSIPAADAIKGQTLPLLVAYGSKDSFNSMHSKFASVEISIIKK